MAFVLNAREDRFRSNGKVLTVSRYHEVRLLTVIGARLILYNPRDIRKARYYGVGQIADVVPSPRSAGTVDILFDFIERLSEPIYLSEMDAHIKAVALPYRYYAKIVRPISDRAYDLVLDRLLAGSLLGLREPIRNSFQTETHKMRMARVRSARVRNQSIVLLGRACLFCGQCAFDLSGRIFETVVVHIVPLENGGPDSVLNTMSACGRCHFLLDHGVIGLDDFGLILIANEHRERLSSLLHQRIGLSEAQLWPRLKFIRWHRENIFQVGKTKATYHVEPQAPYEFG